MKWILETSHLLLRELAPADIDFVAEMLGHPEVMRFWPRPYSRAEGADWIRRQRERYASHGHSYWLAVDKQTGRAVGQAGLLVQQVDGREETGLGYIMHEPFWRRGFATEAAAGCRDFAFQALGKQRIIALIRPENEPSLGVARKLHMTLAGRTIYADFEHLIWQCERPLVG